jgi:acyl-CoA dehydrogenase
MYGLSPEDLAIQARARDFADELIPFEEQAERSGGELPADVTAAHAKRARELACTRPTCPPNSAVPAARASSKCWCRSRWGG